MVTTFIVGVIALEFLEPFRAVFVGKLAGLSTGLFGNLSNSKS